MTVATRPDNHIASSSHSHGKMAGGDTLHLSSEQALKPLVQPLQLEPKNGIKDPDDKNAALKQLAGIKFQVSPFYTRYYDIMRFAGYMASGAFAPLASALNRAFDPKNRDALSSEGANHMNGQSGLEDANSRAGMEEMAGSINTNKIGSGSGGARLFVRGEAAVFTTLAAIYTAKEYQALYNVSKDAIAIDQGKDVIDVEFGDMFSTDNAIINSELSRLSYKSVTRLLSGVSFLVSLSTGLMAGALNIAVERGIFSHDGAYGQIVKLNHDIQTNHPFGDVARDVIVNDLQRIVQQVRLDMDYVEISDKEMYALRPVLTEIATDMMDGRADDATLTLAIGGGLIIPNNPEQSLQNYNSLKMHGIDGIIQQVKHMAPSESDEPALSSNVRDGTSHQDKISQYRSGETALHPTR